MWWLPTACVLVLAGLFYVVSGIQVLAMSPLHSARADAERAGAGAQGGSESSVTGSGRALSTVQIRPEGRSDLAAVTVPIPPDARIVDRRGGTAAPQDGAQTQIALRTAGTVGQVLAFYRDTLDRLGWHEVRSWMARPADGVEGPGASVGAFCRELDGPTILVAIVSVGQAATEVRLQLHAAPDGPCSSTTPATSPTPPPLF